MVQGFQVVCIWEGNETAESKISYNAVRNRVATITLANWQIVGIRFDESYD